VAGQYGPYGCFPPHRADPNDVPAFIRLAQDPAHGVGGWASLAGRPVCNGNEWIPYPIGRAVLRGRGRCDDVNALADPREYTRGPVFVVSGVETALLVTPTERDCEPHRPWDAPPHPPSADSPGMFASHAFPQADDCYLAWLMRAARSARATARSIDSSHGPRRPTLRGSSSCLARSGAVRREADSSRRSGHIAVRFPRARAGSSSIRTSRPTARSGRSHGGRFRPAPERTTTGRRIRKDHLSSDEEYTVLSGAVRQISFAETAPGFAPG
jgi:hypothetical protein